MTELLDVKTTLVHYTYHKNENIHEMYFTQSSRGAVDEWVMLMTAIYKHITDKDSVRLLLDISDSGVLPLNYAIGQGRKWSNSLVIHPEARLAFLYRSDALRSLANTLLSALRMGHLRVRFFEPNNREGAVAWLCE